MFYLVYITQWRIKQYKLFKSVVWPLRAVAAYMSRYQAEAKAGPFTKQSSVAQRGRRWLHGKQPRSSLLQLHTKRYVFNQIKYIIIRASIIKAPRARVWYLRKTLKLSLDEIAESLVTHTVIKSKVKKKLPPPPLLVSKIQRLLTFFANGEYKLE